VLPALPAGGATPGGEATGTGDGATDSCGTVEATGLTLDVTAGANVFVAACVEFVSGAKLICGNRAA